jgi:hypothetical protein
MAKTQYYPDNGPVPVRIPGTREFTLREIEREASRCTQCKSRPRTLFSYDDSCSPFCRIECWMRYLTKDIIRHHRRRKAAELAVVREAERATRAADKKRREKALRAEDTEYRFRTGQVHVG